MFRMQTLVFTASLPDFSSGFSIPALTPTLMKMDFSIVFSLDFVVIMFAFLFVDMFDTLGTLIGVASKADMLDKDGKRRTSAVPCSLMPLVLP